MDTLDSLITKLINTIRNVKKEPDFHTIYDILNADKQPYKIYLEDVKEIIVSLLNTGQIIN